jgi:hypothetical protein
MSAIRIAFFDSFLKEYEVDLTAEEMEKQFVAFSKNNRKMSSAKMEQMTRIYETLNEDLNNDKNIVSNLKELVFHIRCHYDWEAMSQHPKIGKIKGFAKLKEKIQEELEASWEEIKSNKPKKSSKSNKKEKTSSKKSNQENVEWSLLAYYKKDPLTVLQKEKNIDIISIQSGTDNEGKSYYVDAHIKCVERKDITEWLKKAGKYKLQELDIINGDEFINIIHNYLP